MKLQISLSSSDHAKAMQETGYWGRQASSVLLCAAQTGNLLLLKRGPEISMPDLWAGISGAIDEGETPEQAAAREVREETQYLGKIKLIPLPVFQDQTSGGTFRCFNFLGIIDQEFEPVLNHENSDHTWRNLFRWPYDEPIHPGIEWLRRQHTAELFAKIDNNCLNVNAYRHGHLRPMTNGLRARCGVTRMCWQCQTEQEAITQGLLRP